MPDRFPSPSDATTRKSSATSGAGHQLAWVVVSSDRRACGDIAPRSWAAVVSPAMLRRYTAALNGT